MLTIGIIDISRPSGVRQGRGTVTPSSQDIPGPENPPAGFPAAVPGIWQRPSPCLRRLLDRIGRQRHSLGAAQDRQQHLDSLVGLHALVEPDMPGKRPVCDSQAIAGTDLRGAWAVRSARQSRALEGP